MNHDSDILWPWLHGSLVQWVSCGRMAAVPHCRMTHILFFGFAWVLWYNTWNRNQRFRNAKRLRVRLIVQTINLTQQHVTMCIWCNVAHEIAESQRKRWKSWMEVLQVLTWSICLCIRTSLAPHGNGNNYNEGWSIIHSESWRQCIMNLGLFVLVTTNEWKVIRYTAYEKIVIEIIIMIIMIWHL